VTVKYWLVSAEERKQQSPRTFVIPERARRESLRIGDQAKLLFEEQGLCGCVERMWVEILKRGSEGRYVGKLLNRPFFMVSIAYGDVVEFGPEHVADWADQEDGS
jgi:uncharacterized protein YegJ (DUF2314 family)